MPHPRRFLCVTCACTLVAILLQPCACGAERHGFDGIDAARLQVVLDRCYNLEDDAEAQIAALRTDFPDSLVPDFIVVARLYWQQVYVEVDRDLSEQFETRAQALIEKTQADMRRRPDDPDAAVLAALSQLTLGGYHAEHRRLWAAFWKVRAGRNGALRVLKEHPDHPEAPMPVGVLECYAARTPPMLKPLTAMLGVSGDLESGLNHLRDARDRAVLTATDAAFYLCILHFDLTGDRESARREIEPVAQRYPQNPFFQRLLAICELGTGHRTEGRARLAAIPAMPRAAQLPALTAHALMILSRDCTATGEHAAALDAAARAFAIAETDARLTRYRTSSLFGQAEALTALGRYEEAFARFNQVPASDAEAHKRAMVRMREIKKEIGWTEKQPEQADRDN